MQRISLFFITVEIVALLTSCSYVDKRILGTSESQVKLRSYQSRSFDTGDRKLVLRSVIATMQDLDFIVNRADDELGMVSGTSFGKSSKLTVSVRSIGNDKVIVRANGQKGLSAIENPVPYQNFFTMLSQSLFLEANEVE